MRLKLIFGLFFLPCAMFAQQGINNNWLQGYYLGSGESKMDFISGTPIINQYNVPMDFSATHANISSSSGNILFYTNGYYIADATNDTMQNGSGLNPCYYANVVPDGFLIPQSTLILPKPGSNSIYYLFHNVDEAYPNGNDYSYHLYVTTIDMTLNGGLGAVISKNVPIINDTLNLGKITACRHANGRDWWVIVHKVNSNKYYRLLISPIGNFGPYSQDIGTYRMEDLGQAKFSPNGKKFAYPHFNSGLDIFDFDRCTGIFSNFIHDSSIPLQATGDVGCEFSSNSNNLYISNGLTVFQYNLTATNVISSRATVASWDGFEQPGIPNLNAYLSLMQLAPDGKIYVTTGNSTTYFGTIDSPDSVGINCNVSQHSVLLPTYYFNTLPNHPNYFLGCDTTLGCICAVTTNTNDLTLNTKDVKAFPNPTTAKFTLQFNVQSTTGSLEVYDINGKLILQQPISPWSQYKQLNISNFPTGIYYCKLKWGSREVSTKVIKQ